MLLSLGEHYLEIIEFWSYRIINFGHFIELILSESYLQHIQY